MDFLNGLFKGIANGFVSSAVQTPRANAGVRHIEKLCAELGWAIDERLDDSGLILHFKDAILDVRPLLITSSDSGKLAVMSVFSTAKFPADKVPPTIACYLLAQNKDSVCGAWRFTENDAGEVGFSVWYAALLGGLDARYFKLLCTTMVKQVSDFDSKLRHAGVI